MRCAQGHGASTVTRLYTELIWQIGPSVDPLPYLMNMHPAGAELLLAGTHAGPTYLVRQSD